MDEVTHFDVIHMHSVAEDDEDSAMDVTPHASSPSRRASFGESVTPLWSTPLSGISNLTGGGGGTVSFSVRLLLCKEVDEFCGGAIRGSGNDRFCGKQKADCTISQNSKGDTLEKSFVHQGT
jgi:hypothetical protein